MIEVYSKNVNVQENQSIPFNVVALKKGATVTNSGSYELIFNQCGVYEVTVSATVAPTAQAAAANDYEVLAVEAPTLSMTLVKDGVLVPQATSGTSAQTAAALSFSTLVQVNRNNTPCVCSTPVVCSVRNTGAAATYSNVDVVITKIV